MYSRMSTKAIKPNYGAYCVAAVVVVLLILAILQAPRQNATALQHLENLQNEDGYSKKTNLEIDEAESTSTAHVNNVLHSAAGELFDSSIAMDPKVEVLEGDAELLWQVPAGEVQGVLFVAHGCQHGAIDFWPKSEKCRQCLGLPEEVRITQWALRNQLAIIAISSLDRQDRRCWQVRIPPEHSEDLKQVYAEISRVLEKEHLKAKPIYAFGASSGGAFVLSLALRMRLAGVIPQIMSVKGSYLLQQPCDLYDQKESWKYPPTAFIHMARDIRTAEGIADDMAALQESQVPVTEIQVEAVPLTPTFLADRVQEISPEMSLQFYSTLKEEGFLDEKNFLKENPRESRWRDVVADKVEGIEGISLVADASPIAEELNVAYASHEIVADYMDQAFQWLQQQQQQQVQQQVHQ